jgi:hypothetical protein
MFRVSFLIPYELWHAFRLICLQHHTTAAHEMRRLIQAQLAAWRHDAPDKETTP